MGGSAVKRHHHRNIPNHRALVFWSLLAWGFVGGASLLPRSSPQTLCKFHVNRNYISSSFLQDTHQYPACAHTHIKYVFTDGFSA